MFVVCDEDLLPELNALEAKSGVRLTPDKLKQIRRARHEARKAYKLILSKIKKWKVLMAKELRRNESRLQREDKKQTADESAEEKKNKDSKKRLRD